MYPTHLLLGLMSRRKEKQSLSTYLNKNINLQHKSLGSANDELVHTSNGMWSDLGAWVFEELQELGYQIVQRSIQLITIQSFYRVLTDFLQCSKGSLVKKRNKKQLIMSILFTTYKSYFLWPIKQQV